MSTEFDLRLASAEDAAALLEIYRPHVEAGVASFEETVPSVSEFQCRIQVAPRKYPWLVAEKSSEQGGVRRILGYAYASQHRERAAYQWSTEVSVYVAETAQRRGVGRRLYAHLMPLLEAQGFRNAYAVITLPNESSIALHEQLGFSKLFVYPKIGFKHGAWRDVGWWMRLLTEEADPKSPRLVEECGEALRALGLTGLEA